MIPRIAVIGTLDTKGPEHAFLAGCIRDHGGEPVLIDVGVLGPPLMAPDHGREEVLGVAGMELPGNSDRGSGVATMALALPAFLSRMASQGRIQAAISLGGGGGTAIATAGMRALPLGFPKIMVTTLASGNVGPYLGTKDIVMFPSIVDVAGLNRISRGVFRRAAAAICAMAKAESSCNDRTERPLVVASMFGNTTACVTTAVRHLEAAGMEVLVFHATGTGGQTMENLIAGGQVQGVLDITTTEWADELAGGILSAGPHRLEAAGLAGLPTVLVPGCLDMVNFGEPKSVPSRYDGRVFYHHNPQATLMRTSVQECQELGRIFAEKANDYKGPVTIHLPLRGISMISQPGQPFHDPDADTALFHSIRDHLRQDIPLVASDLAINDEAFALLCADSLLGMMA